MFRNCRKAAKQLATVFERWELIVIPASMNMLESRMRSNIVHDVRTRAKASARTLIDSMPSLKQLIVLSSAA